MKILAICIVLLLAIVGAVLFVSQPVEQQARPSICKIPYTLEYCQANQARLYIEKDFNPNVKYIIVDF